MTNTNTPTETATDNEIPECPIADVILRGRVYSEAHQDRILARLADRMRAPLLVCCTDPVCRCR